jgi:polysaccharide biosynthesis/export protein
MMFKIKLLSSVVCALVLSACATENVKPPNPSVPGPSPSVSESELKTSPLDQLWRSRLTNNTDFPIGVGDVIAISFPGLQGLDSQSLQLSASERSGYDSQSTETVRVDGKGDVVLPLLGRVHAAGLTEEELRAALVHNLDRYMYDPEVRIFVKSYSSREVAVSGEVHSPGMYTVHGPTETIHDLIIRAGGITTNAAQKIVLTPGKATARASSSSSVQPDYSGTRTDGANAAGSLEDADDMLGDATPYVVDLSSGKSAERYLAIPVRPGDMLYVPRAGSVTVTGWVYSPRSFEITNGLTVLGAVSQAGGTLFAADASRVKVLRQGKGQETRTLVVNLNNIKAARTPDVLVQANDIIDVPYSPLRIPGYAFYYGMQGLVSFAPAMLLVGGAP